MLYSRFPAAKSAVRDRQIERQRDRETERQRDRPTDRQADRLGRPWSRRTCRQADRHLGRPWCRLRPRPRLRPRRRQSAPLLRILCPATEPRRAPLLRPPQGGVGQCAPYIRPHPPCGYTLGEEYTEAGRYHTCTHRTLPLLPPLPRSEPPPNP